MGLNRYLPATGLKCSHECIVATFHKKSSRPIQYIPVVYIMRVLVQLLLLGVAVGVAAETIPAVHVTPVTETSTALASSTFYNASPSESTRIRKLRASYTSPTPSPTNGPTEQPTAAAPSGGNLVLKSASSIYHTMVSFVCPILSLYIMAWAVRRTTKRKYVCCGDLEDTVPGDIMLVEDDHSVIVGDCSTDVELMPVSTKRSHEWTDCGAEPMADIPIQDGYDWVSDDDSIQGTQFVRMKG
jgi:hypothetical protein